MSVYYDGVPVLLCLLLNLLAFLAFGRDKLRAKAGTGRTPERLLLGIAAVGPFGALAAMLVFRHKTRHYKFFLVPVFAVLHLFVIAFLWLPAAG